MNTEFFYDADLKWLTHNNDKEINMREQLVKAAMCHCL